MQFCKLSVLTNIRITFRQPMVTLKFTSCVWNVNVLKCLQILGLYHERTTHGMRFWSVLSKLTSVFLAYLIAETWAFKGKFCVVQRLCVCMFCVCVSWVCMWVCLYAYLLFQLLILHLFYLKGHHFSCCCCWWDSSKLTIANTCSTQKLVNCQSRWMIKR